MSADLFAEFANSNPPPQQQQQPPPVSSAAAGQQNSPVAKAPFSFGFNDFTTATASPIEQWPSIASQPGGAGSWATGPALSLPQTMPAPQALNDVDDDGWGDFETAQPTPAASTFSQPSDPFGGFSAPPKEPEMRNRPVRAPTIDIMTNTLVDIQPKLDWNSKPKPEEGGSSWNTVQTPPRFSTKSTPRDPNVLFDADDFELQAPEADEDDDDDFGDFEAVAPAPMQPKQSTTSRSASSINPAPLLDLLSLDDPPVQQQPAKKSNQKQPPPQLLGALSFGAPSSALPNAPKSPSFQERNPFPDLEIKTNVTAADAVKKKRDAPKSVTPVTAWPAVNRGAKPSGAKKFDDDWDAWDDTPNVAGNAKHGVPSTDQAESWDWGAGDGESDAIKGSDDDPPPTNVPPPSVILSAFPSLFSSASAFFKPISGHSASIKQQVLSNPKAVHFLQGYILLAATAARVIAGRKHRWHRDKILAKSMSISAAGSKGMKLAGVDKTQSAREDREAADVVAVWREYVGRLRSAIAAANAEGKFSLRVPELSENMLVQTAKMVPTGPKPCIICGLKREERVSKVDYEVEDSFGEWWVEHWGHRACKNFWVEHEQKLRQR